MFLDVLCIVLDHFKKYFVAREMSWYAVTAPFFYRQKNLLGAGDGSKPNQTTILNAASNQAELLCCIDRF